MLLPVVRNIVAIAAAAASARLGPKSKSPTGNSTER
jgi:hypothetical protein